MNSNQDTPDPPQGYKEPISLQSNSWGRGAWIVGMFIVSILIYTPSIRHTLLTEPIAILNVITVNALEIIVAGVSIAVLCVVPHEYSHNIVAKSMGYPANVKWNALLNNSEPFNYIPDIWIDTNEYNIILLSPLFLINFIGALLVIMEISPLVSYFATAILIINTLMSSDDIRMVLIDFFKQNPAKVKQKIEDGSLVVYRASK